MVFETRGIENLSAVVNVRLTPDEKNEVQENARCAGLSVSEFVRRRTLGRSVIASADMAVIRELRRLGGLLKRVHLESEGAYRAETWQAIAEITHYIEQLAHDRQKN